MLSLAIQSALDIPDRSKMWLLDSLTYRFMAEARRLWDIDSCKESFIPTIQAAMIISYTTTNNGMDQVGALYLPRALEMSKVMDLFGPTTHPGDPDLDKARVFTAWALYSWQALFNFSFFRPPPITKPPLISRPDANVSPEWYGEVWMQYPHTPARNRLHVGHKLQAEVQLRHVMNELGSLMFGGLSSGFLTLDEIAGIKRKLDSWKHSLPVCLQPKNLVFPLHLSLHVQYQQLLMGFMQIVLKSQHKDSPQILAACSGKAPETVLDEARIMLETIMRLYYTRHNFEFYNPWISFALTAICNAVVANLAEGGDNDPQITAGYRSTLIIAAQGLSKQARNYHVSRLLAIKLQKAMKPEDLQLVQTHAVAVHMDDEQVLIAEHSDSLWPIPGLATMNEDPERTKLKNLVAGVQDLDMQSV
ncbi:Nitrogen assimilation transcription factor nit-4 [Fusarium oxysporum f. sp. rapae]|uniref:Nitrogen assimilation transcription factor nit-4 n=1 Tax=Fusarium oxysporum f. sp. rapae TaxID=485398 RepID=A0A8J5TYW5_FUSOX|nr:Nitrogen assimilation transcription factor nit-4 [Fusarium oxysporum f. sp. rapae]